MRFTVQKRRLGGNGGAREFIIRQAQVDEHLRFEEPTLVLHRATHLDSTRGRVDELGGDIAPSGESLSRKGAAGEGKLAAGPEVRQIRFRRVNLDPKTGGIGNDKKRRSELRSVSQHLVGPDLL